MKLTDYSFRDIDKKIVKLEDESLISNYDVDIPYYGVVYIDHVKGISMRIIGDDKKSLIEGEGIIFRYDDIKNLEFDIINNYKDKNLVYKLIDSYYNDRDIISTRNIIEIDNYRLNSNPDVISICLIKDKKEEKVWSRIIGFVEDGLVCSILSDTKLYKLSIGTNVGVKYDKDTNRIIVIGRVDL